jgi:hypothetical protein
MKKFKIVHWIFTGLLSALMLMSAGMYLFNTEEVSGMFTALGFTSWIIYPLAIAKLLGVLMLLSKFNKTLTTFAYAGFLFNFLLAFGAHMAIGDGEAGGAVMALILWAGSFSMWKIGWGKE